MQNELTIYEAGKHGTMAPYTSFEITNEESASQLFKAMNQADEAISDYKNMQITIKDVFVQSATQIDEETGELKDSTKVVIFDEEGKSYGTISKGFYTSMCNVCAIIGEPRTWKSPITITIKEVKVKRGNMITFDVIDWGSNIPSPTE